MLLTDDEVFNAVSVDGPTGMADDLTSRVCPTCQTKILVTSYALRRRSPHMYCRVSWICFNKHKGQVVYLNDWIGD
jgi:hypothetical protein